MYLKTDCFLICVALDDRSSMSHIDGFVEEIKMSCQYRQSMNDKSIKESILLVGTKKDLHREDDPNHITTAELEQEAATRGFMGFVETSAKDLSDGNVDAAFS